MKNVLFVTSENVSPQSGGITRVTYLLADGLSKKGIRCISAYTQKKEDVSSLDNVFEYEKYVCGENHIKQYQDILCGNMIDVVVVQGAYAAMNQELVFLRNAINSQSRNISLYLTFHSMPGYELYFLDWSILIRKIFTNAWREYSKQFIIQTVMLINKSLLKKLLYKKYSIAYHTADKVILLSSTYEDDFNLLAQEKDKSKYIAIPNMLTYPVNDDISLDKQNEVLIVARMDERSKRIKLALQIWGMISQKLLAEGWKLTIVGEGDDLKYYKHFVESKKICNVSFEGRQNPLSYYQRASIFMMTSSYEGWPMTLMEAMQNKCVPIVFDSYASLHDIIISGRNGIIVENNNINAYVSECISLMKDTKRRLKLAENALHDCKQFSQDKIIQRWLDIL